MSDLKYIFEPKSVAVIGASVKAGSVGNGIFSNILQSNFVGPVYPVNPKYESIMSVRAYKNVLSIKDNIDLAVICVPSKAVTKVLRQCAKKKIKGIVIITAGFKETGNEGKKLEDKIIAIGEKNRMALVGPNVLGIINTDTKISLNANFAHKMPKAGNVALISQSGAIGIAALDYAHQHDVGISKFVSIGNEAILDESDILEYLIDDESTHIITIYSEDIRHPAKFFAMANKASSKRKPIIIIKAGRSAQGALATHSHTGALSKSDTAYNSLFAQCGTIRVETLSQLFEYSKGFVSLKHIKGNRIAVITNGGGMGVIATDAAEKYGLKMATFENSTLKSLKEKLPSNASIQNPVDVIGDADAERLDRALTIIAKDKNVDAIVISILPTVETDMDTIALNLSAFAKNNPNLPILGNLMSLEPDPSFEKLLERAKIPNFDFPETNVRVLATMIKYYNWIKEPHAKQIKFRVNKSQVRKVLESIKKEKRTNLSEPESYKLLEAYGMKVLDYRVAKDKKDVINSAGQIGYPVVLKIISPDLLHKLDVGGVKINLRDESELMKAFDEVSENIKSKAPDSYVQGYLIQKYFTSKGFEIIAGANVEKGFGSLIMFGLGGTFVELFKDVSFRLAPLTEADAINMIKETKGYQILKGYRGQAPYDIDAVVNYLLRLSQLVIDFPEIKELDMNPIKVLEQGKGIGIMDAKAILSEDKIHKSSRKKNRRKKEKMAMV